jgi:hypothetical protein
VVLVDTMLYGGSAIQGGAIFNSGDLTLTNVDFVANEAGVAAGVWNHTDAILTATNSRWLQNLTTERLGNLITSNAQVDLVYPGSDATMGLTSIPPRGATALFNAGIANLRAVEIGGNISETGAAISNVGDSAELRIENSLIYENESRKRESNLAPSVLVDLRGTVAIVETDIFNNTGRQESGGTIFAFEATMDLDHVGIFNNPSPSHGFDIRFSNFSWNHVTYVRSGTRGVLLVGGKDSIMQVAASAIDRMTCKMKTANLFRGAETGPASPMKKNCSIIPRTANCHRISREMSFGTGRVLNSCRRAFISDKLPIRLLRRAN